MTSSRFALAALLMASAAVVEVRPAAGQSLQEALALAYSNNPTLQAARANLRAVDENVPQALAGWRPTVQITGSAGQTVSSTNSGDNISAPWRARNPAAMQGSVTQPIYQGGRTTSSTRRAENQVLAQRARLFATEQQVMLDTVNAYVAVIRDQEEVRLNTNNVQVLTRQLQATNERFRVGEITRTDVAQAESRLAGAIASRAESEGRLQTSRATFTRIVGQPPLRLTPPQPLRPPALNAQEAGAIASQNNPNVVAALFDEAAARDFIDVQFSNLMPQVGVTGSLFRNDNTTIPDTRTNGSAVTANVTVPLFQGGREHSLVRQARQQAQQSRQVVEEQRRTAMQQASAAFETLMANRATVESVRAQIRAAEIALDGVQREAIVGSRTTLDVLNAEQELLNARVSLVRALANVISASHSLAAAVGRLTARDLNLPVQLYDMEAYYREVRNRWVGWGDYSEAAASRSR
ncbi:TolC family outer membrane protein [Falsiroseomonas oryzae]|uniref:TolC family outer membrane protein n=1 Tax=Falsiroseomonas oryzae TaxID=2766473 RepID=UPI0022EABAFE|nr:TolC family outer membrane protein [Roseomonas sp. MO-31]